MMDFIKKNMVLIIVIFIIILVVGYFVIAKMFPNLLTGMMEKPEVKIPTDETDKKEGMKHY